MSSTCDNTPQRATHPPAILAISIRIRHITSCPRQRWNCKISEWESYSNRADTAKYFAKTMCRNGIMPARRQVMPFTVDVVSVAFMESIRDTCWTAVYAQKTVNPLHFTRHGTHDTRRSRLPKQLPSSMTSQQLKKLCGDVEYSYKYYQANKLCKLLLTCLMAWHFWIDWKIERDLQRSSMTDCLKDVS